MFHRSPSSTRAPRRRRRLLRGATLSALLAASLLALPVPSASARCPVNDECGGGGGGGGTTPPPVGSIAISTAGGDRTAHSIKLTASVPSDSDTYSVHRISAAGDTVIDSGSVAAAFLIDDTGLAPDTRYCYEVVTTNSNGTGTSPTQCTYTHDTRPLSSVFRVQVQFTTGNVGDGGTDDDIAVTAYGPLPGQAGTTYIKAARHSDFSPGDTRAYDLVDLPGIDSFSDLEGLTVWKPGDDEWCLADATVLVNGIPVYTSGFGDACQWIGNESASLPAVTITHDMLRSQAAWNAWQLQLPPLVNQGNGSSTLTLQIPKDELASRVEASVSQGFHGKDAKWNTDHRGPVILTPSSSTLESVDMGLVAITPWYLPNADVEQRFQLSAGTHRDPTTNEWKVDILPVNASSDVDFPWWADFLYAVLPCGPIASVVEWTPIPFCLPYAGDRITEKLTKALADAASSSGISALPSDVTATFDGDGNLNIVATIGVPNGPPTTTAPPDTTPPDTTPPSGGGGSCCGGGGGGGTDDPPMYQF